MFHSASPMVCVLKKSSTMRHKHNQSYTQQPHPLTVIGVAGWSLRGRKIHHTVVHMRYSKNLHSCAPSVSCSNKTPPYGRLRVHPCKLSTAASHYCPIKAVGAMWAAHVTTNSPTVCCVSSQRIVTNKCGLITPLQYIHKPPAQTRL